MSVTPSSSKQETVVERVYEYGQLLRWHDGSLDYPQVSFTHRLSARGEAEVRFSVVAPRWDALPLSEALALAAWLHMVLAAEQAWVDTVCGQAAPVEGGPAS